MRKVLVVGIGAGNPDFITVQAIDALNRADVFFIPDKGTEKAALAKLRTDLLARHVARPRYRTVEVPVPERDRADPDYRAGVEAWHARLRAGYERLFAEALAEDGCGAFLVWGDPTLYDSTLRILDGIRAGGFAMEVEVIPGISAVQALAAAHGVALNRIGEPVVITPARRLAEGLADAGMPDSVVMLDDGRLLARLPGDDLDVHWGAYVGTPDEILVSGRLADVRGDIERLRAEARARHGWIMDTYLLRTRRDG